MVDCLGFFLNITSSLEVRISNSLIVSVQGIGNTLLATPLIKQVSEEMSEKVDILVRRNGSAELLANNPYVDQIFTLPPRVNYGLSSAISKIRRRGYQRIYEAFPPSNRSHFLLWFLGWQERIGFRLNNPLDLFLTQSIEVHEGIHDVSQNLRLLSSFNSKKTVRPFVLLSEEEKSKAEQIMPGHDFIGFHIGSSGQLAGKRWSPVDFARTIDLLYQAGFRDVAIFGGGVENDIVQDCIQNCRVGKPKLFVGLPIRYIAALISRCLVFVSNDSGLMHLATSLAVPTIGIYGPTNPARTAPYGKVHRVIQSSIHCAPCYKLENKGGISCQIEFFCMELISAERVVSEVLSVIKSRRVLRDFTEELF